MWTSAGTNRWTWTADDDQHLLLRQGDLLIELHGTTKHTYRQPDGVDVDPVWPLAAAVHVGTATGAVPAGLTDEQAYELLGG